MAAYLLSAGVTSAAAFIGSQLVPMVKDWASQKIKDVTNQGLNKVDDFISSTSNPTYYGMKTNGNSSRSKYRTDYKNPQRT